MIEIGDVVLISDRGRQSNYRGRAEVRGYDLRWYYVEILEDHEPSGYSKGDEASFFQDRVHELPPFTIPVSSHDDIETSKPTNPKDAIGSDKLPLHLWPETATAMGCLGLLEGALKYGRNNWRETGVRATIYIDALKRHTNAWLEGEDFDPDSGMPHLAHALACLAILVDAQAAGKLNDDRNYPGGYTQLVGELTPLVKAAKEHHADKSPKHWTIQDA